MNTKRLIPYRIAFFTPHDTPILRYINNGFLSTLLRNDLCYNFCLKNASGDMNEAKRLMCNVLTEDYDLLLTLGQDCTHIAKTVMKYHQKYLPTVFCSVGSSVLEKIFPENSPIPASFTGTSVVKADYIAPIKLLRTLKMNAKRMVFLYLKNGTNDNFGDVIPAFHSFCVEQNMPITFVAIEQGQNLIQEISLHLCVADVLLVARDHKLVQQIPTLAALCRVHKALLCSFDLESVKYGATLGIGDFEYVTGVVAAEQAQQILQEQRLPYQLPVSHLACNYKLMVNKEALRFQDVLPFSQTLDYLNLVSNGLII